VFLTRRCTCKALVCCRSVPVSSTLYLHTTQYTDTTHCIRSRIGPKKNCVLPVAVCQKRDGIFWFSLIFSLEELTYKPMKYENGARPMVQQILQHSGVDAIQFSSSKTLKANKKLRQYFDRCNTNVRNGVFLGQEATGNTEIFYISSSLTNVFSRYIVARACLTFRSLNVTTSVRLWELLGVLNPINSNNAPRTP